MGTFKTTKLNEHINIQNITRHCVQDRLLAACIGYSMDYPEYKFLQGFSEAKRSGYVLLVKFVSIAFDLYRQPYHEDRICSANTLFIASREKINIDELLDSLSTLRMRSIIQEVKKMYENTQRVLKVAGLSHIKLRREIKNTTNGYHEKIMIYKTAATVMGKEKIPVDMDILNSFTDSDNKGGYGSTSLQLNVPIENVLYSYPLIYTNSHMIMENDEWVIINRSHTGIMDISISDIEVSEEDQSKFNGGRYGNMSKEFASELLSRDPSDIWRGMI